VACIAVIYKNSKNILFKCTKLFYTLESDTDCFLLYDAEEEIFIKNMVNSTKKNAFSDTNIELRIICCWQKKVQYEARKELS